MPPRIALLTRGVRKALGNRPVLRGIDLEIAEGECVVVRGDNGSGKTTLLRCLAGLLRPDEGLVRWFGQDLERSESRARLGWASHESNLHPNLTIRENLVLAARLQGVTDPGRFAERWLGLAGLGPLARRLPREVSQGMRRRASIARAALHDPPLLLLDEPTAGLDEAARQWLVELLGDRGERGQATCLVTHDDLPGLPRGHRILQLHGGSLCPPAPHAFVNSGGRAGDSGWARWPTGVGE